MTTKEIKELKDAYADVFDKNGNIRLCGRVFCRRLMYIMSRYSCENLGDIDNGVMNVKIIKSEYDRIVG